MRSRVLARADSDVEAQWHPSPTLRTEPDGPWYAVRTASEVRPSGRVSEAEGAEILAAVTTSWSA